LLWLQVIRVGQFQIFAAFELIPDLVLLKKIGLTQRPQVGLVIHIGQIFADRVLTPKLIHNLSKLYF